MAKVTFKSRTNAILKAKYVEKKTFKKGLKVLCCVLLLLGLSIYRLYELNDFNKITTYYNQLTLFVKGFF